jgi:hypothetical protein
MATRKQKHAAAVAKHEQRMEELRLSGLKALEHERARRQRLAEKAERERLDRILEEENQKISKRHAKQLQKVHKAADSDERLAGAAFFMDRIAEALADS